MSLIQPLPAGPLDIVGDIHGESLALEQLLAHLGYDAQGRHADGRTLVFVGDLVDRGPDSPAVVHRVRDLVEAGRAVAVLGNHEINLLRDDPKEGAGWFFEVRAERDQHKYAPFASALDEHRAGLVDFLSTLPIALERADLRVVHAAWQHAQIEIVRRLPLGSVRQHYDEWERAVRALARASDLRQRMDAESAAWPHGLEDPAHEPPDMPAHGEHEVNKQMLNPLKVLTGGVERRTVQPFFAGGKWRFVQRVAWWDEYDDEVPVVVGHYWRRLNAVDRDVLGKGDEDIFGGVDPLAWHGRRRNVFCVDFSVGGRWAERRARTPLGVDFKLAALRWPERVLVFDDGETSPTRDFGSLG
ncbi:MAG: metallophosphoesterase [Gammaproteobacteria bacterium]|nr:metallophosphoesterase [Gammaproteobacteria bacterium]MBU1441322.1 metallophosphoesterase [Gammaproteobacteria bacterium]MBU2287854.1 metallophosphoesterase [Gammaproteobacteria bacterium]